MKYSVRVQQRVFQVEIEGRSPDYVLTIDGERFEVNAGDLGDASLLTMLLNGKSVLAHTRAADRHRGLYDVSITGAYRRLEVLDELASVSQAARGAGHAGPFVLEAPMPGVVVAIRVKEGDIVEAGTPLVVMEAMKMQNELASEVAGTVKELRVELHQAVESGYELLVIEPARPT